MGGGHSTYVGQSGLEGPDRESVGGSPDVFMIEPVPEGLEHVVYPKYEEAFRLGLQAFTNPMRVNKFYRPLPHILGSTEFQKSSHAGIIPLPKPSGSSAMPTPRQTPFREPPRSTGSQEYLSDPGRATAADDGLDERDEIKINDGGGSGEDWKTIKEAVTLESTAHRSFGDFEEMQGTESRRTVEEGYAASEADADGMDSPVNLDPVSSVQALDGGLFDADEAMSNALETYRRRHRAPSNRRASVQRASSSRSQLTRSSTERSQMLRDLEQLGKSINDLQQQVAARDKR